MKKFSKILESLDSEIVSTIKDIFIDLQDKGFVIKTKESSGYYTINLTCDEKNDWMECARELVDCDKRLSGIDLEYIDSTYINLGPKRSEINIRYKLKGILLNSRSVLDISYFYI